MPDGRRAPMHAEIIELYHAPSGEKVDVMNLAAEAARALSTQPLARERVRCLAAFSAAARAPVLVPSSAASAGWEQRLSTDDRRSV